MAGPNGTNGDKPKHPGGRPPKTLTPVGIDETGAVVTAAQQLPALIRVGMYLEGACGACGIRPHTAYEWLRIGAMAFAKRHTAEQMGMPSALTPHEETCLQFNQAVVRAESEWDQEQNLVLGQLGRGGLRTTKTTVKRGPPVVAGDLESGPILETTTVTEVLPPNERVIMWRMERRFPEFYGRKIEVTDKRDAESAPSTVDHAEQLLEDLDRFLSGAAPGANGEA